MKHNVAHEVIAKRAYFLWEAAGYPHGRANEFWLEAEAMELAEFVKWVAAQAKETDLRDEATPPSGKKSSQNRSRLT